MFIATSLDGFIAGDGDDLSWLPQPEPGASDNGFGAFLSEVGALLMGRRTYDVFSGFGVEWPYGDRPLLVATNRFLPLIHPRVRAVQGSISEVVEQARNAADGRDVYIDGGQLIREATDAGLVDEITLTLIPVLLGRGLPLFAGITNRKRFALKRNESLAGGLVQLTYESISQ